MRTHILTLLFVIGTTLGVVCGETSLHASDVAVATLALIFAQSVVYFLEKRKRNTTGGTEGAACSISFSLLTLLFCFGVFIGITRTQFMTEKANFSCSKVCSFRGEIISSPRTKDEYQVFVVRPLETSSVVQGVQVRVPLYPKYEIGDFLFLSGKVLEPKNSSLLDTQSFDYISYLAMKDIGSEMFYPKIHKEEGVSSSKKLQLGRWKDSLVTKIETYVRAPESSLASGMLFGASSMSENLVQTFRTAGLSHIVVLSGFNIAILIGAIFFILKFLPLTVRVLLSSVTIIFFVLMTGGGSSIVRATLMSFVGLLALLVGRAYVARQALIVSLFCIGMYDPLALLYDPSLHLSFLATAGIIYMSGPLLIFLSQWTTRLDFLRTVFVITFSAYIVTLPYSMYAFGTASLYSLLANIFVVPLIPLAMLVTFLVASFSYVSEVVSLVFGFLDTTLISIIIMVASTVEALPHSLLTVSLSFFEMSLGYLFIIIFFSFLFSHTRKVVISEIKNDVQENNETSLTNENKILTGIISY